MKKSLSFLKLISLLCCLAMVASALFACGPKEEETEGPDDTDPVVDSDDGKVEDTDPVEPSKPKDTLIASNQKVVNGKISVNYKITEDTAKAYEKFYAEVHRDDETDNLYFTNEINPAVRMADIDIFYGKQRIDIVGVKADGTKTVVVSDKVSTWDEQYNFAMLNATFPVVYYTIDLFSMASGETRENYKASEGALPVMDRAPTFVTLDRATAYDWEKLPENVYPLPNTTYENATSGNFHPKHELMAEFIKELYTINPSSEFHFYCVDNYCELILEMFVANGIPEKNYDVVMISDGTATVTYYKTYFGGDDAETKYNAMKAEWERIKKAAAEGDEDYLKNVLNGTTNGFAVLQHYPFVIANEEENVEWWCSRDLFTDNTTSQFIKDKVAAMESVKYIGINNMLKALSEADQAALKELFHYDSETFSAADEANKKILLILGTSAMEENLEDYLAMLNCMYADEYVIYYKGHPKYPTGLNQEKNALFAEYDIVDIDASIAAELILFYRPDIYLTGWQSTTFKAAQADKLLILFNHTKVSGTNEATTNGYGDMPDMYANIVTHTDGKTYVKLENHGDDGVSYYDVEGNKIIDALPA